MESAFSYLQESMGGGSMAHGHLRFAFFFLERETGGGAQAPAPPPLSWGL